MTKHNAPVSELDIRKGLGRAYLNADRIDKAVETFAGILRDYPSDVEVYVILGDCYLADGKTDTAVQFYQEALKLSPNDPEVERRLRLAHQEDALDDEVANGLAAGDAVPTNSELISKVLQRMTQRTEPISEDEISRAAELLQKVINSPHPAQEVSDHLDEIDSLLPALLELNIRQARTDGRPDLAKALQNLLDNICLQIGHSLSVSIQEPDGKRPELPPDDFNILFISHKNGEVPPRLALSAEALSGIGCQTEIVTEYPLDAAEDYNVVCMHRPHVDSKMLEALAAFSARGIAVLLDLDADYEQMPVEHQDYEKLGLGTLAKAKAYNTSLLLADHICVPNNYLASILQDLGFNVSVIPDGWSSGNELWDKPSAARHTLHLGWIGMPGQIDDVTPIRRIITRVLREYPHVRLVIGGDSQVYRMFDSLPESRRLFLPLVSYEDYPYLLSQVDILVTPLRNNPYNRSLSDRWLMESGVRRIPWVASPISSVIAWGSGGLIANTPEEWHTHLRQLVLDEELREALGRSGRKRSEDREMSKLVDSWYRMIYDTCQAKQRNSH